MQPTQWRRIRRSFTEMPYRAIFLLVFLLFILLNIILNELRVTFLTFLRFPLYITIPYFIFFLLIPVLVAMSVTLAIMRTREMRALNAASGMSALGAFGGMIAGACPGCFAGLFPAFLGLFGVTLTLSNLPFNGVEIQAASAALLLVSIHLLSKDIICEVPP